MKTLLPLLALLAAFAPVRAAGAEPAAEAPAELSPEAITQLIEQLRSEEAEKRSAAAEALGKARAEGAIPTLIPMLDDPDDDAQWKATVALAAIGKPALPKLIDSLTLEKERARWKAEAALKLIGSDAVPALATALGDKRARVRQSAAFLLGEIKDAGAADALAAALADRDEDTRWKAADSLTKLGADATAAALKQLRSPNIEARRCAAWVFQTTRDPKAIPTLVIALRDPDDQVRWKSAIALQKIGAAAAEPLLTILRSNAPEAQKNTVAWVLEGIKDVRVQTALRDLKGAMSRGGTETPERPRPKVLPKSITLAVTSEPAKATVFVDDRYAGVTPLNVRDLTPGHHFLKLTKRDHLPWTKLCELLHPQEEIKAKLTLKPKGTLRVTSAPPQADVYIDGEYEGKTPLEKKNLDANPYSVRVEKEHFLAWETEVDVEAGKEHKIEATLQSKIEGWYMARLKKDPNDVSCHTELGHYYIVRGQLDKSMAALAGALEVMGRGADTSAYATRLVQEIAKIWGQTFQFGGDITTAQARGALHKMLHGAYTKGKASPQLRQLFALIKASITVDFTQPPK
ncbi:PEGA domain-containing protein [bacterium]|nr:PEGA domain-containing protein [bacterium]